MSMVDALQLSLSALVIDDRDQAAVELAYSIAREIDDGGDVEKLSFRLQALLETLLLTPRARAAATKGGGGGAEQITSPIDELRARRKRRASPVDSPDPDSDT